MTEDLQQLLEKIQRDGVDKAKSDADKILADARAQAKALTDQAKADADKMKSEAEKEAEAFGRRAEETIRQAARDTVLNVEKSVTDMLSAILLKDVQKTMDNTNFVKELVAEAVKTYLNGKEDIAVAAGQKLADVLRSELASKAANGVTIITDENTGAGFSVRLSKGRIEHTFTGAAVADALSKQLRPRLAALLK